MFLWFLLQLATTTGWGAPFDDGRLGGHLKSLDIYQEAPPAGAGEADFLSVNSLRLEWQQPLAARSRFEFAVEGRTLYADPAVTGPRNEGRGTRRLDLEKSWHTEHWFSQQAEIDRLNLSGTNGAIDWTLGRQAIGFGRVGLFSPLDVIAPFPPDALDTDVRPGIDGLRVSRYFGQLGQLGAVLALGPEPRENVYLVHGEENLTGIDLLLLAGQLRERPLLGGGFATQLGGMGLKGEATSYRGDRVGTPEGDPRKHFTLAALEVDYRFTGVLLLATQYLYNGPGTADPARYPAIAASAPLREGLTYLLGRHYLFLSLAWELHPLATASTLLICNLDDDSWLLRPLLKLSLADNLSLELFWTLNQGKKPKHSGSLPVVVPRSEFGAAGDGGGGFLKYYF